MLVQLTELCLQPIETALERTKIETLVTVHVHQRDIAVEMKCQSVNDFDWQKQTRLYWKT
jgi:dynein heavy chain